MGIEDGRMDRREFLRGVGALAGAAAVGGESMAAERESIESHEAFKALLTEMLQREPRLTMGGEAVSGDLSRIEAALDVYIDIIKDAYKNLRDDETYAGKDNFRVLRAAIEQIFDFTNEEVPEPVKYNRDASSVYDLPIHRRMNCRSGTYQFITAAAEVLSPEDLERMVIIYTPGHMLPGYIGEDGQVYALEMTANVADTGPFNNFDAKAARVVKAAEALKANLDKPVGRDAIVKEWGVPNDAEPTGFGAANQRNTSSLLDKFSFGKINVPPGDIERKDIERFDYSKEDRERADMGEFNYDANDQDRGNVRHFYYGATGPVIERLRQRTGN